MSLAELVFLSVLVAIDQISKYLVVSHIALHQRIEMIKDFFYLTHAQNTGVAWSMFADMPEMITAVAVFATAAITVYFIRSKNLAKFEKIALLMIMSGAIGNVIDRLFRGFVIDFLDFYIFGYDYPVFNIADSFIVIGAVILIAGNILDVRKDSNGRN